MLMECVEKCTYAVKPRKGSAQTGDYITTRTTKVHKHTASGLSRRGGGGGGGGHAKNINNRVSY